VPQLALRGLASKCQHDALVAFFAGKDTSRYRLALEPALEAIRIDAAWVAVSELGALPKARALMRCTEFVRGDGEVARGVAGLGPIRFLVARLVMKRHSFPCRSHLPSRSVHPASCALAALRSKLPVRIAFARNAVYVSSPVLCLMIDVPSGAIEVDLSMTDALVPAVQLEG
jgi:hypothetical protein